VDTQAVEEFKREAQLMLSIPRHPHVLPVFGVSINEDNLYVVIEFCAQGSLESKFGKSKSLPLQTKLEIIRDLAAAVSHLHDCGIVHRDIAARNILLGKGSVCRLSDFGMARIVDKFEMKNTTAASTGPIRWMAPESIRSKEYSCASDVWFVDTVFA
jgi:serine/threonine protein kinase